MPRKHLISGAVKIQNSLHQKFDLTAEPTRVKVINIVLFGCKDTTLHTARFLKELKLNIHLVIISPKVAAGNQVQGTRI